MAQEEKEQVHRLWRERAWGRVYMGVERTGDDVESKSDWCQSALGKALDATAKKIRICTLSTRWLNGEIMDRRRQLRREKRRRHRSAATAKAKAEFQNSIQRAKDTMRNDNWNDARGAEVCRAGNLANTQAGATVEALTDRDGKQANTITKKDEMPTRESFTKKENDQYLELHLAGHAHKSLTEYVV